MLLGWYLSRHAHRDMPEKHMQITDACRQVTIICANIVSPVTFEEGVRGGQEGRLGKKQETPQGSLGKTVQMTQIYTLFLAEFGSEEHPELPAQKVDAVGQGLASIILTQFLVSLGGLPKPGAPRYQGKSSLALPCCLPSSLWLL